jgi:hypothetical protein
MTEAAAIISPEFSELPAISPDLAEVTEKKKDKGGPDEPTGAEAPPLSPSPIPTKKAPKKKSKRGGKRKGAGRPKKSKPPISSPFEIPKEEQPTPPTEEPTAPLAMLADMDHVAGVFTHALDGLLVGVASMRYGPEKAQSLHGSKKALEDIQGAAAVWLKHTALMVTPGQALIVAIGATYGPPLIALEMEKRS